MTLRKERLVASAALVALIAIGRRPGRARHIFRGPGSRARGASFLVITGDIRPDRPGAHQRFILRRAWHRACLSAHLRNGACVLETASVALVIPRVICLAVASILGTIVVGAITVARSCYPLTCVVSAVAPACAMCASLVAIGIGTCAVMPLMLETCMRIATTGPEMRHGRPFGKGERTQHSEYCAQRPTRRFRQPCVHHVSPARGPA
jgi:hypothetical protein